MYTVIAWSSVTTAVAVFDGFAMLETVIITVWLAGATLGAENTADVVLLTKLPNAGLNDHVTPVLLVPVTVAVKVRFCNGCKDTEDGVSETVTGGSKVTVAVANLVGSATLVAVTATVWELEIEAGAVYRPAAVMLPTTGLSDHVTAALLVLVTVAEKVWV
jgi:hypothetical protein